MTMLIQTRAAWVYAFVSAAMVLLAGHASWAQGTPTEKPASNADWKIVAKRSIKFRGLIQRIDLAASSQPIRSLKIRTRGRRMTFSSIKVRFRDGTTHHARRRIRLKSGELSAAFAASSQGRLIDEIILVPDVSAPRRNIIGVEIHGLVAKTAKLTNPNPPIASSEKPTETRKTEKVTSTPLETVRANKSEPVTSSDEQAGTQEPTAAPQPNASIAVAKPAARAARTDKGSNGNQVTTKPLNRLAATSNAIELPIKRSDQASESSTQQPSDTTRENTRAIKLGAATSGGGLLLGVRSLGSQDQPDSFEISARPNRFQRVRLHLSGRDVQINHIALHFADGTIRKEPFDITLMRNTSSRWIAVDPVKPLSKVVIHRGVPGSERGAARVELIGRPVLEAMLPEAAKLSGDDGWVLIASQSGRTVRINDGRMPVAANRGGFAKLRLVRVGRLPMPNGLSLWNGTKPDELIELRSAKNSDEFALSPSQRQPVASIKLKLSARAMSRLPNSGVFQIWAKY